MLTCRGCGAKIIWARSETGKDVPLDARHHPIYVSRQGAGGVGEIWERLPKGAHISHFATCPAANQFSRTRKEKP